MIVNMSDMDRRQKGSTRDVEFVLLRRAGRRFNSSTVS
jgi:hypothetical protein